MTFLVNRTDGRLIDVDAVWDTIGEMVRDPEPPSPPGEETSDGARLGFVLGVRLALDDPALARIVMARYERCVGRDDVPPEVAEQVLHDLAEGLIDLITVLGASRR